MSDQIPANLLSTAVKEVVQQAQSLGLVWTLRIATVTTSVTASLVIVFDGDTVAISATNITGTKLTGGDRVYCIMIPQSGNFVIGLTGATPPIGFAASRVAVQVIPDSAATALLWDTQVFSSPTGYLVLGALPASSITVPTGFDGIYSVTANTFFNAAGTRNFLELIYNGNLFLRSYYSTPERFISVSGTRYFVGGDVIQARVFQNSGGALTTTAEFWLYRVG